RRGGGLEQAASAPPKIAEVHASGLGRRHQALGQVERVVDERRLRRRVLAHIVQDRALGARGHDRRGDALDPDAGAAAVAPLVTAEGLERVDLVGPRVLAETEEDHVRLSWHGADYRRRRPQEAAPGSASANALMPATVRSML